MKIKIQKQIFQKSESTISQETLTDIEQSQVGDGITKKSDDSDVKEDSFSDYYDAGEMSQTETEIGDRMRIEFSLKKMIGKHLLTN